MLKNFWVTEKLITFASAIRQQAKLSYKNASIAQLVRAPDC